MQKTNIASVAIVPIVKKTVFALKTRPVIAPKGLQRGTFISAINETPEKGDEFNRVIVTIDLEATDGKGKPFQLTKPYNIMPNGRGAKAFVTDYNAWSGSELTEDDLYESFNGEMDKGKSLVAEVGHRKIGNEWQAFIEAFHPAGYTEQAVA